MELKGRNLRVNMKDDVVRALQRALRQLDFEIDKEELEDHRFGKSTSRAVRTFQKDHKLEPTGEVGEKTADLIHQALAQRSERSKFTEDEATYSVSGYVRTTENIPVPDIVVEAFDRKVGRKTLLSPEVEKDKEKTNEEGFYRIDYTHRLEGLTKHPQVDLYVHCYAKDDEDKRILARSDLLINAPRKATVNLEVPKELRPAPTEFERLLPRIKELVGEGDLAGLDDDDYEYLATKLKLDIRKIKGVVHALLLAQQASKYETDPAVPAGIFYALIGDEELSDIESLVSRNRSSLKQTIQEAIGKEIIPSVDEEEINQIVAALKDIAVAIAVEEPEDSIAYSLRNQIDILDTVPQELRDDFIRDYTLNEQGDARFWEELKKKEKFEEYVPAIQDLFTLADLTQKNLPLIRSLYRKNKNIGEFAKWRIQDWQDYLRDNELPLPQDDREFTREQYALMLAQDFKRRFPMVDLIDGLERSQVLTGDNRPSDALKLFLSAHPDLDLGKVPVDRYVRRPHVKEEFERKLEEAESAEERAQIKKDQERLVKELRDVQLAHALAPSRDHNACVAALRAFELEKPRYPAPQPMSEQGENEESQIEGVVVTEAETDSVLEIADRGILDLAKWFLLGEKSQRTGQSQTEPLAARKIKADSVLKTTSMNKADFITAWQELRKKDGATDSAVLRGEAEEIYKRAQYQAFGFAVNAWNVAAPLSSVTPAFIPNTYKNIQAQLPDVSSDTALTIANLTTLFGNQHYCECRHCQSIYSPAAYLVQLYDSLSKNAQDVLSCGRRPDILGLHLDCENTNTKLPYIDLVIEQLEQLVGESVFQALTQEYPHPRMNHQTTLSEKELALRPEHEFSDAYVLLSSLPYPMSIPWDKWFEEARLYLDYMGLPLYRLVEIFAPAFSDTTELEGTDAAFDFHEHRKKQINSKQCVGALLGLSVPLYDLISKPLTGDDAPETVFIGAINSLFGLYSENLDGVRNLTDFMGKLGLWQKNEEGKTGKEDFKLFRRILGSRYIQDSRERSDLVIDIAFDQDHPCDPSHAEINNYNWDTIIRVVKFEHLRRALRWSPDELNQAIIVFSRNIQSIWDRLDNYITSGIDIIVIRLPQEIIDLEIPSLSDVLNDSSLRNQMSALVRASFVEAIDKFVLTHISNLVYLLDADAIERIPELVQLNTSKLAQDLLDLADKNDEIPDDIALKISEILERLITEEINEPVIEKISSEKFLRLGTGAINERLLAQISHLVRLQEKRAGFPVTELLSWWGPIDTDAGMRIIPPSYEGEEEPEQVSLYEKVYLDKSLYGKRGEDPQAHSEWSYFVLNSKKTELAYLDHRSAPEQISAHRAIVCAALQITETELSTLVASICGTDADRATLGLTLNNLSALYRAVSLVRYLDISVHELALLLKFVGSELDPFKWTHQSEPTKTEATLIFVECVEQIKRSPFEIRDLAYLWQHHADPKEELEYVYDRIDEYLPQLQEGLGEVKDDVSMPSLEGRPISVDEIATMLKEIGLSAGDVTRIGDIIRDGQSGSPDDESFIERVFSFLTSLQIDDLRDLLLDNRHSELLEEADVYKITDQTLEQLQREGVPDDVRQKLESIKGDEHTGEKAFLDAVKTTTLESDEIGQYKSLILTHADKSLQKVVDYLTPIFKLSLFLSQELGNFFGTSREVVRKLLLVLRSATIVDSTLLQDFVHWDDSPQARETIRNHILRLEKIVQVVDGWKLTDEEIEHIQTHSEDFNDFAWNRIPIKDDDPYATGPVYEEWSALADYVQVRNQISVKKGDLIELFVDARDSDKTETVLKRLSGLLNLELSELKLIVKELGYIDDISNPELEHQSLRNGESIKPVIEMAEAIKRCGRSFEVVRSWVGGDAEGESEELTLDASFMLDFPAKPYDQLLQYKQATVQEIRNSVKARCSDSQWQEVARRFQDQMRVLQRDRLLDGVITWRLRMIWCPPAQKWVFVDPPLNKPEDVYDYLLIDPLVNPCMNTTRLKLAISSVQLFIHRILMGLERDLVGEQLKNEVETTVLADEWKWKKNYRVWEAQQKVFVYPENWIEPELRDNKTPFFEEFESELSQSEIDDKSVEKAYINYLKKVDEVGNLEVASFKEEILYNDEDEEIGRELHVIGRTREKPRTYYYRKRNRTQIWLPWERIDLDIDSEVVMLTIYNGLPYLFWPTLNERIQKTTHAIDTPEIDRINHKPCFDIRFNWSFMTNGTWSSRRKTDEYLIWMYAWRYQELFKNPEELLRYKITHGPNTDELTISVNVMVDKNKEVEKVLFYVWNKEKINNFLTELRKVIDEEISWEDMLGSGEWGVFRDEELQTTKTFITGLIDDCESESDGIDTRLFNHDLEGAYDLVCKLVDEISRILFFSGAESHINAICRYTNNKFTSSKVGGLDKEDIKRLYELFSNYSLISYYDIRFNHDWPQCPAEHNIYRPYVEWNLMLLYEKNSIEEVTNGFFFYEQKEEEREIISITTNIASRNLSSNRLLQFAKMKFVGYKLKAEALNSIGDFIFGRKFHDNYSPEPTQFSPSGKYILSDYYITTPQTRTLIARWEFSNNALELHYNTLSFDITRRDPDRSVTLFLPDSGPGTIVPYDTDEFSIFFYQDARYCYLIEDKDEELFECTEFHNLFIQNMIKLHFTRTYTSNDMLFSQMLGLNKQNEKQMIPYRFTDKCIMIDSEDNEITRPTFKLTEPFGIYNWEIFFHMPFTIAVRLSQQKKFAEAQQWFHYIFNPLASLDDGGEYLFSVGLHLVAVLDQGGDVPEAITEELTELGYQLPLNPTITVEQPGSWWAIKDSDIFILLENGTLNVYGEEYDEASKYWNFLPLHQLGQPWNIIDNLKLYSFSGDNDLEYHRIMRLIQGWTSELAKDPFQPHRIARLYRKSAYQKAVVMKYLDNLIEWGDTLFTQDTIESINEATHLYILAAKILGPRPRLVPRPKRRGGDDGTTVRDVTSYSEGMVVAEYETMAVTVEQFPSIAYATLPGEIGLISAIQWFHGFPPETDDSEELPSTLDERPVFCVPHNEKLLSYWDTVADRLFKVRNCMNIEGVVRELPIFQPPIDPGLLVRGQALGIDISELLSDLYAPLPPYRFRVVLQKAYEFCGDVQKLGGALLSALEKKDAEELSLLRSKHERALLKLTENIKKQQIKELRENLKSLRVSLEMAESRFEYYSSRKFENQNEKAQVSKLDTANAFNIASQAASVAASIGYLMPQIHAGFGPPTTEQGGKNIGDSLTGVSRFLGLIASIYTHEANLHSIQGSRERRMDDWKLQARQASKEIKQIKKQLLAAEIRLDIAEKELENHQKQQEQAEEIETFMKSKFTNKELYHWMVSQISGVYFQTYRMAVGLAKTAQRCYRHELGDDTATFIGAAYWDNLKKGLLAGEKLQFDLRRMENAYLEQNNREYELTKHVSLAMLDPVALLELKETGECYVNLPEAIFDLDYPGHYMRRIKAVSLTIPCVTGPYTNVNCTLTLQSNRIRKDTNTDPEYAWGGDYNDGRFVYDVGGIQAISTSSARDDSGLFELNFHDERYLPFEGAGAISTWHIELPKQFRQFDYDTISDVVIHVRYTARDGGVTFKGDVEGALTDALKDMILEASRTGLYRLFSAKHEFPSEWHRFFQLVEYEDEDMGETKYKHRLRLELSAERFPYQFRDNMTIKGITLFLKLGEGVEYEDGQPLAYDLKRSESSQIQDDEERNRFKTYVTPEGETVVGLLVAEPFQNQEKPLAEDTTWWFEVEEESEVEGGGIIPIPASLQQTATIKGEEHACLKPDTIEDIGILCHYSVTA